MMKLFYIEDYDWYVEVYCLKPEFDSGPIRDRVAGLNIKDKDLYTIDGLLRSDRPNWGFTFSEPRERRSVMVVGPADSQSEYFNTIIHEASHLSKHIAQRDGLDPFSEEVAYLVGDMAQSIYGGFKDRICLCCSKGGDG